MPSLGELRGRRPASPPSLPPTVALTLWGDGGAPQPAIPTSSEVGGRNEVGGRCRNAGSRDGHGEGETERILEWKAAEGRVGCRGGGKREKGG
eukprot:scaffold9944_cov30-Tisochrysis_lutea.AAC.2